MMCVTERRSIKRLKQEDGRARVPRTMPSMWKPRTDKLLKLAKEQARSTGSTSASVLGSPRAADVKPASKKLAPAAGWEKMKQMLRTTAAAVDVDIAGSAEVATASPRRSRQDLSLEEGSAEVTQFSADVQMRLNTLMGKVKWKRQQKGTEEGAEGSETTSPVVASSADPVDFTESVFEVPLDPTIIPHHMRRRSSDYMDFNDDVGGRRDSFEEAMEDEDDPLADPVSDLILLFHNAKSHLNKNCSASLPNPEALSDSDSENEAPVVLVKAREVNVSYVYEQLVRAECVAKRVINSVIVKQNIITKLREQLGDDAMCSDFGDSGMESMHFASASIVGSPISSPAAVPQAAADAAATSPMQRLPSMTSPKLVPDLKPVPMTRRRSRTTVAVRPRSPLHEALTVDRPPSTDGLRRLKSNSSMRRGSMYRLQKLPSMSQLHAEAAALDDAETSRIQACLEKARAAVDDLEARLERSNGGGLSRQPSMKRIASMSHRARRASMRARKAVGDSPTATPRSGPQADPLLPRRRSILRTANDEGGDFSPLHRVASQRQRVLSGRSRSVDAAGCLAEPKTVAELVAFSREMNWLGGSAVTARGEVAEKWRGVDKLGMLTALGDKMLIYTYFMRMRSWPLLKKFTTLQQQLKKATASTSPPQSPPVSVTFVPPAPPSAAAPLPSPRTEWASFQEACAFVDSFAKRNPHIASNPLEYVASMHPPDAAAPLPPAELAAAAAPPPHPHAKPRLEKMRPPTLTENPGCAARPPQAPVAGAEEFHSEMAGCLRQLQTAVRSARSSVVGMARASRQSSHGGCGGDEEGAEADEWGAAAATQTDLCMADMGDGGYETVGMVLSDDFPTRPGTQQTAVSFAPTISTEHNPMDHVQYVVCPASPCSFSSNSPLSSPSRAGSPRLRAPPHDTWDELCDGTVYLRPRGLLVPTRKPPPTPDDHAAIRPEVTHMKLLPGVAGGAAHVTGARSMVNSHLRESVRDHLGLRREGTPATQAAKGRLKLLKRQSHTGRQPLLPSLRMPTPGTVPRATPSLPTTSAPVCTIAGGARMLALTT